MKEKTAVEMLAETLSDRLNIILSEPNDLVRCTMISNFLIDEDRFLAIEKQQLIDSGVEIGQYKGLSYDESVIEAQQYYDNKYKN